MGKISAEKAELEKEPEVEEEDDGMPKFERRTVGSSIKAKAAAKAGRGGGRGGGGGHGRGGGGGPSVTYNVKSLHIGKIIGKVCKLEEPACCCCNLLIPRPSSLPPSA